MEMVAVGGDGGPARGEVRNALSVNPEAGRSSKPRRPIIRHTSSALEVASQREGEEWPKGYALKVRAQPLSPGARAMCYACVRRALCGDAALRSRRAP